MREIPNSQEAEQSVLGSMIMDAEAIEIADNILATTDFYKLGHQFIFKAMIELNHDHEAVDFVTLQNKLIKMGVLEQIGGLGYLGDLVTFVPTSAHIKQYAKIVKEKAMRRDLATVANEIADKAMTQDNNINYIIDEAEKSIVEITKNRNGKSFTTTSEAILEAMEDIEKAQKAKGGINGIETGFIELDKMTTGLKAGDFILVAARPSMGKTAFALNIVQTVGIKNKKSIAFFSLEMSRSQLATRLLSGEALVEAQKIRAGLLEDEDLKKLGQVMPAICSSPIFIDDTAGITIKEIKAKCRQLKHEKKIDLIVIDYLQLISSNCQCQTREREISEISRELKMIAKEMEVPIIALSQLSRACETRQDHRPMLSDLRESGAIEQDADLVMFLYRDEYYNPHTEKPHQAELIIAKQRNGETGTVPLIWLSQYTRFVNMVHEIGRKKEA